MITMFDFLTDEDLHSRYALERFKYLHDDFVPIMNALAERWREADTDLVLSEFMCQCGTDITGIPDLEHFTRVEMFNTWIVHNQVELIPDRWAKKIGIDMYQSTEVHRERDHRPVGLNEFEYRAGRF